MNKQAEFLESLHIENTIIQIGTINNVDQVFKHRDIEFKNDDDIYFVANVNIDNPFHRCGDKHIPLKSYVFFDFDLLRDYQMDINEIEEMASTLSVYLTENVKNMLSDWTYIVFSGGGLHIYYLCDPTPVKLEAYKKGYDLLCEQFNKDIFIKPDISCKNPARLARLPYTFNKKRQFRSGIVYHNQNKKRPDFIEKMQKIGQDLLDKEQEQVDNMKTSTSFTDSKSKYPRKYPAFPRNQAILLLGGEQIDLPTAKKMAEQSDKTIPCYAFCHKDKSPSAFIGINNKGWFTYHCSSCNITYTY